jgi:V/A-type H+/Na+-transporting ATPase subunit I
VSYFLNTPEPMWRLRVLTPKDHAARTLTALQRVGVLHPEQSTDLEAVDRFAIERDWNAVAALLRDIEDVLAWIPQDEVLRIDRDVDVFLTRPVGEIRADTRRVCAKLANMHRRASELEDEAARWQELLHVATALGDQRGLTTGDFSFSGENLFARLAVLPRDEFDAVKARLEALTFSLEIIERNADVAAFLIGSARLQPEVEVLVQHHGRFVTAPGEALPLAGFAARAEEEITRLARERSSLRAEIESRTREELEELVLLREGLRAERERLALLRLACESQYVTLIEGWVPASALEEASAQLREEIGCVHIAASEAVSGDAPPSRLRNPAALRPFEVVIGLFATPRYGEWDPTPIVAYFFALFFGLMLGDAVYGVLLLLIARYLLPRMASDPEAEGFRRFCQLLSVCAGAAIFVGVLTGSYLGDFLERFVGAPDLALSQALKGFYLDPMTFIVASLCIGLVHVNLGHLLMLVRGVRERQAHAIIGRLALFLLQLATLPWILRVLRVDWLPLGDTAYAVLALLGLVAVGLIIAASLMERGGFLGSILWVFDITGILGDVMSYARLAGVGLATYFLAYSFNMIAMLVAGMLPDSAAGLVLSGVAILSILLLGHLLNLVLSSITCFVHALRLCFVEFLFKFYEGGGRPYVPFRLRRRTLLPVKAGGEATG